MPVKKPSSRSFAVAPAPQDLVQAVALMTYIDTLTEQQQIAIRDMLISKFKEAATKKAS